MELSMIKGVFRDKDKLFTENLKECKGQKVYNEKLIKYGDKEFRSWNPYRSKLAAAILNGLKDIEIASESKVLYLGAATGTTVSHISDIVKNGVVYAVEISPIAGKSLLQLSKKRCNIIPILSDASHPDRYTSLVPTVDFIYQDISQRNQAEIFVRNVKMYLKKNSQSILMVKSRSIDVSLKPKDTYSLIADDLKKKGFEIIDIVDLQPYEKDHAAIVIQN